MYYQPDHADVPPPTMQTPKLVFGGTTLYLVSGYFVWVFALALIEWSCKQKRAYHRVKSGVRLSQLTATPIKHIVLTTSLDAKDRNLCNDFQVLRKRVLRKFNVDIPYFCVRTNEGNGVLHLVVRTNAYIPQRWLSSAWSEIHDSPYVFIKRPPKHIANYVVSQYVSSQESSFVRCSWSHSWVCSGFVRIWHDIKNRSRIHGAWRHNLYSGGFYRSINFDYAMLEWDKFLTNLSNDSSYDYWKAYPPDTSSHLGVLDENNETIVLTPQYVYLDEWTKKHGRTFGLH